MDVRANTCVDVKYQLYSKRINPMCEKTSSLFLLVAAVNIEMLGMVLSSDPWTVAAVGRTVDLYTSSCKVSLHVAWALPSGSQTAA